MPETQTQVREITFAEAIREALAEEMRRDPRVFIMGEDVAEAGTPFKVLSGLGGRIWNHSRRGYADFGSRIHGSGSRRGDDRPAACRRYHVRRFHHTHHGSDGEPGRESALHVRRKMESSHGDAHDAGSGAAFGGAALAIAARLVQPRSRFESSSALDAVRREGPAEIRDSRRQSGDFFRRQDELQVEGPGARRRSTRFRWAWRISSASAATSL